MRALFRINNEHFGIMHLNSQDPQEVEQDLLPSTAMIPKGLPLDFFFQNGLTKGDPVTVCFDAQQQVVALERQDGGVLWAI